VDKNIEQLKDKIARIKEKSREISKKISSNIDTQPKTYSETVIPAGLDTTRKQDSPAVPASFKIENKIKEEELRHKIAELEQEKSYLATKLTNIQNEKILSEARSGELSKKNEELNKKLIELDKGKKTVEQEVETIAETLKKFDQTSWNKYSVDLICQFIGEASRYFRNSQGMINEAIKMCTDDKGMSDSLKKKIAVVQNEILRVLNVFSDAKTKYTFKGINIQRVNLKNFIENVVSKNTVKIQNKVKIETRIHDSDCYVNIDPDIFEDAFSEMITNSSESILKDGVIRIESHAIGRKTVIEISDTGLGVPPHLMDKIYCPFFSTKQDHTGLGLTRVYWVVQLHKAEIDLESQVNAGTKITIILPEEE